MGGLSPHAEEALERHLASCVACRLARDGFARLDALLQADLSTPEPPVPVSVMANVRHEVARRRRAEARWSRLWSPVTVAAAVLLTSVVWTLAEVGGWQVMLERTAAAMGLVALPEFDLGLRLDGFDLSALQALPAPSLLLLTVGVLAVVALNLALCRGPVLRKEIR